MSIAEPPDPPGPNPPLPPRELAHERRSWRKIVPAPLRHGAAIFLALLVLEYLVIPRLTDAGKNLSLLGRLDPIWLVAGFLLEAASLLAYAFLSRSLLPRSSPSLFTLFRIDLAGNAVAHVVPGGSAGSAGLGFRLLTARGVPRQDAGFAIATQGMGSAVVLNVLLWISLVVSIPFAGLHSAYESIALLVGMLALLAVGALVFALTRGEEAATRMLGALARPIPRVGEDAADRFVRRVSQSLRDLGRDRGRLHQAIVWAVLNWLLDAASLWAFVAAFGHYVFPFELFVAYGVANVLAVIPITPGGLGFVEVVSSALLASFGVPANIALLAVLGWRLVNFWLPIPLGGSAYISLRVGRGKRLSSGRSALREMAEQARARAPTIATDPTVPAGRGPEDTSGAPAAKLTGRSDADPAGGGGSASGEGRPTDNADPAGGGGSASGEAS